MKEQKFELVRQKNFKQTGNILQNASQYRDVTRNHFLNLRRYYCMNGFGCGCNGESWIWIILLLCCCGNGNNGGCIGGGDSSWIWIILLLCCCGNNNNQLGNNCGC